jgi:hypothetical protein
MERFEEFLKNVSDKTLVYYKCAFKSWEQHSEHSEGNWKSLNGLLYRRTSARTAVQTSAILKSIQV